MYVEYFNSGNIDGLASLHTEDAVVMPPNGDFTIGRDKISLVLKEELDILGIENIPSAANFITTIWKSEQQAHRLSNDLLAKGIIVRHLASFGWPNCVRISIGTEKENNRIINALKKIL